MSFCYCRLETLAARGGIRPGKVRMELEDTVLKRKLMHKYPVRVLSLRAKKGLLLLGGIRSGG